MGEGEHQHQTSLFLIDSAGLQVKQSLFVDLSDSCAMRTFHIIVVDYKLRFGIHPGGLGEQNAVVSLECFGLFGAWHYMDPACKSSRRIVIQHVFEDLIALASGLGMFDRCESITMLILVCQRQSE